MDKYDAANDHYCYQGTSVLTAIPAQAVDRIT